MFEFCYKIQKKGTVALELERSAGCAMKKGACAPIFVVLDCELNASELVDQAGGKQVHIRFTGAAVVSRAADFKEAFPFQAQA